MSFIFPTFLFGLFAVAIPVIIHLFSFRSFKIIYFSNVKMLKNIKLETKSKSQLRHILILIARILAVICLVLAFAQPYIPSKDSMGQNYSDQVGVYFDNSFSMQAEGKHGKLFEVAKNKCNEIAVIHKSSTKYFFLTNDFLNKHQFGTGRELFQEFSAETAISPSFKTISQVLSRLTDLAKPSEINQKSVIYLISDFQRNICDFGKITNDTTYDVRLIPLVNQNVNNLYIDSIWFETPQRTFLQEEKLFVKVKNNSNELYTDIPLRLFINDSLRTVSAFNIEPTSYKIIELNYVNSAKGFVRGKVEIIDFPITYDNTYYFSYKLANQINILVINENIDNVYLKTLFESDTYFKLFNITVNSVKPSDFNKYQVIILSEVKHLATGLLQELLSFSQLGGTLAFFPDLDGDIQTYNLLLNQAGANTIYRTDTTRSKIETINHKHFIFKNVFKKIDNQSDLPEIKKRFLFSNNLTSKEENILSGQGNQKIISYLAHGKGKIFISAIPFSMKFSNFVQHSLFVPVMYNIALYSEALSTPYYTIGINEPVEVKCETNGKTDVLHIKHDDGSFDFVPQLTETYGRGIARIDVMQNISNAGNYFVTQGDRIIDVVSFNFNRKESDVDALTVSELKSELLKNRLHNFIVIDSETKFVESGLKDVTQGKNLWKLFIILALFFLAAEIILLRLK